MREETTDMDEGVFYHKRSMLMMIVGLTSALLFLFVIALARRSGEALGVIGWIGAGVSGAALVALIIGGVWVVWHRPVALSVTADGVFIPLGFQRAMPWTDIAQIRRVQASGTATQSRDWLVITLRDGATAPYRHSVWRWLERWHRRTGGLRIGVHGLEGDPDQIIASIARFHPVTQT